MGASVTPHAVTTALIADAKGELEALLVATSDRVRVLEAEIQAAREARDAAFCVAYRGRMTIDRIGKASGTKCATVHMVLRRAGEFLRPPGVLARPRRPRKPRLTTDQMLAQQRGIPLERVPDYRLYMRKGFRADQAVSLVRQQMAREAA